MRDSHISTADSHYSVQTPLKKRKTSAPDDGFSVRRLQQFRSALPEQETTARNNSSGLDACGDDHDNISISASSKQAGQTVAPFLSKHIPEQYAPGGGLDSRGNAKQKDPNTKYCYRHRPDLKCRRQANEPSMDQLQHVCSNQPSMPILSY